MQEAITSVDRHDHRNRTNIASIDRTRHPPRRNRSLVLLRRHLGRFRQRMVWRLDTVLLQPLKHITPNGRCIHAAHAKSRIETSAQVFGDGSGPFHLGTMMWLQPKSNCPRRKPLAALRARQRTSALPDIVQDGVTAIGHAAVDDPARPTLSQLGIGCCSSRAGTIGRASGGIIGTVTNGRTCNGP